MHTANKEEKSNHNNNYYYLSTRMKIAYFI